MRRWSQRALFACAVVLLGYCAFVLVQGWRFQRTEDRQLAALRQAPRANGRNAADVDPAGSPFVVPRSRDGLIGRLEIPRLGLSAIVMEGTGASTLRHAIGHVTGMALPGQSGNIGIAGHRDTFFRPLRNVLQDDIITFTTTTGTFRYRVVSMKVVDPRDVEVLDDTHEEVLTLVTCYPFYFAGPAPDRFIVRAQRIT